MKKIIIAIFGALIILVLGVVILSRFITTRGSIEYYTLDNNALYGAGKRYVSGSSEFPIQPTEIGSEIGRSKDNAFRIYELKGDSTHNWVVLKGDMSDGVYREEMVSPINLTNLKIEELQLIQSIGGSPPPIRISKETEVFEELSNSLKTGSRSSLAFNTQTNVYIIRILSSELKGLRYWIYGTVDKTGRVYISNPSDQVLIPADDKITHFITGK